jgi:hypothetical protein
MPTDQIGALEASQRPTDEVVFRLRQARNRLEGAISPGSILSAAVRAIRRIERRLERPLRVALLGEFNSGKTSLVNLLARIDCLPIAAVSNTRFPALLYFAPIPEVWFVPERGERELLRAGHPLPTQPIFRVEIGLPSPRLRAMEVLDLPGFADPRFATADIQLALHHIDAVLWCTVSTQAWKESEREMWSRLPARLRAHGLLVVTHRDLLRNFGDAKKVMSRLRDQAGPVFRNIVFVSTLDALSVMKQERKGLAGLTWSVCGAEELDKALDQLLLALSEHRSAAALEVTGRIARRALARIPSLAEGDQSSS